MFLNLISQNRLNDNCLNVNFQAKVALKSVTDATILVPSLAIVATGLIKDTFVKEKKEEDVNFEQNIKMLSMDRKVLQKFEQKYGIKGKTYSEKKNSAENKSKILEILIKENKKNDQIYPDEDTRCEIFTQNRDLERLEDYISLLNSISCRKYTKEEVNEKNALIKNFIKLSKEVLKNDDEYSDEYEEMNYERDVVACKLANYGIVADIYTLF